MRYSGSTNIRLLSKAFRDRVSAVRIVILMNDEPVYLGPFVRKVIAAVFNEVVGLILVPGSLIRSGKGRL